MATTASQAIQNDYRRRINTLMAGMVSNTMPCTRETGRFATGTIDGVDRPDTLPFGYACGWTGENEVARYIQYRPFARLHTSINTSVTTIPIAANGNANEFFPGVRRPAVGEYIIIEGGGETEWVLITGTSGGGYTVTRNQFSSGPHSFTVSNSSPVNLYAVGGSTNFAGVAIKNLALPGDNSPVDTYNAMDLVSVGSRGDFTVVCDGAVSRGDMVSVNVGTDADDYGKFSNESPVHSSLTYIGIPGAVFMSDSVQEKRYGTGATGPHLAVMRLDTQPR